MAIIIVCFGVAGVHFGGSQLPLATAREKSFVSVTASWFVMTAVVVWGSVTGAILLGCCLSCGMRKARCTLLETFSSVLWLTSSLYVGMVARDW